jgi:hypothetical protein
VLDWNLRYVNWEVHWNWVSIVLSDCEVKWGEVRWSEVNSGEMRTIWWIRRRVSQTETKPSDWNKKLLVLRSVTKLTGIPPPRADCRTKPSRWGATHGNTTPRRTVWNEAGANTLFWPSGGVTGFPDSPSQQASQKQPTEAERKN